MRDRGDPPIRPSRRVCVLHYNAYSHNHTLVAFQLLFSCSWLPCHSWRLIGRCTGTFCEKVLFMVVLVASGIHLRNPPSFVCLAAKSDLSIPSICHDEGVWTRFISTSIGVVQFLGASQSLPCEEIDLQQAHVDCNGWPTHEFPPFAFFLCSDAFFSIIWVDGAQDCPGQGNKTSEFL